MNIFGCLVNHLVIFKKWSLKMAHRKVKKSKNNVLIKNGAGLLKFTLKILKVKIIFLNLI